eukprot:5952270-Pleurochrysis_carterae.AAC.2
MSGPAWMRTVSYTCIHAKLQPASDSREGYKVKRTKETSGLNRTWTSRHLHDCAQHIEAELVEPSLARIEEGGVCGHGAEEEGADLKRPSRDARTPDVARHQVAQER